MFVAVDGQPAGLLGVADPIKPTTPEAIAALHEEGMRIVMLTGDSRTTAEAVAAKLGIDEVEAEVLPDAEGRRRSRRLQAEGRMVAMAGDGINDAPALAQAEVGIAMGTGTDVAMESAGVTLVKGDLRGIVRARRLSRAPRCATSGRTCSSPSSTTRSACRSPPACSIRSSGCCCQPDDRRRGDELQLGVGDRQRPAAAQRAAVTGGGAMTAESGVSAGRPAAATGAPSGARRRWEST